MNAEKYLPMAIGMQANCTTARTIQTTKTEISRDVASHITLIIIVPLREATT
jgi:hypothetical protein